jgi:hypothetical protein
LGLPFEPNQIRQALAQNQWNKDAAIDALFNWQSQNAQEQIP